MSKLLLCDLELDVPANWKDQGMVTLTLPSTDKNIRPNIIVTKERLPQQIDLEAYDFLKNHFAYNPSWETRYFTECQAEFLKDPLEALILDTKEEKINEQLFVIGQLELSSAKNVDLETLTKNFLASFSHESKATVFIINMAFVNDGFNHIFCSHPNIANFLATKHHVKTDGQYLKIEEYLLLRKEILRDLRQHFSK